MTYKTIKPRGKPKIPWGYEASEDPDVLEPLPDQLEALERILDHIDNGDVSYAKASMYLSYETGRSISHEGRRLIHKLKTHPIYTDGKENPRAS